ncbi:hypothetical protein ACP70R_024367 [Stipagrostis hirtigluma subsp. patula]
MAVPDAEDDEAFLLALDAAEAEALESSSKRRRLSTSSSSPTLATSPATPASEGPYLAALKGSHSSAWKQQQQQAMTYPHKRPDGTKTLAPGTVGTQVASGACFKCGDPGHWARECPQAVSAAGGGGGIGGGGGYAGADGEVEEKACPCGAGSCLVLTSNTPRNPGRKFYKCPMRDNGGCNFFEWCDTPSPGPANAQSNVVFQSETSVADMLCPCGAGTCLIFTAKTGQNVGRQFYRCPANQGGGSCGFFKWCDEQQLRAGAPFQASPQYQTDVMSSSQNSNKRSSSSCFKCGQENHWAKDCPNQSSDPYPDKGGRTLTSASSPDACFKCGKAGHWSRDCPSLNYGVGTGASHVKSSLGSWNSHRYG